MTTSLPRDESDYRQSKQKFINDLLKPLNHKIDFVWVGKASRRRVSFQIDKQNNLGFFREKSHDLMIIDHYDLAEDVINQIILPLKKFIKKLPQNLLNQIVVTSFDNGIDIIFRCKSLPAGPDERKFVEFAKEQSINCSFQLNENIFPLYLRRKNQIICNNFNVEVDSDVFIQATKSGLHHIISFLANEINKHSQICKIADLYCGFGVYAFSLLDKNLIFDCFEGSYSMVETIKKNLRKFDLSSKIKPFERDLFQNPLTAKELNQYDNIIINPPRNGAEPQIKNIAKSNIKTLQYVSCNPSTLLRDSRILIDSQYNVSSIKVVDQFYSTKHYEVLISFIKS